jgi:hypothetical protein
MRLESLQPENESDFYGCLSRLTSGDFFYERLEPSDESGCPDIYFVARSELNVVNREGMIELKYTGTLLPNLRSLARGTQKAALLEYHEAGGRRRFALCYAGGTVYLWNTVQFAKALRGDGRGWTASCELKSPVFRAWLHRELTI